MLPRIGPRQGLPERRHVEAERGIFAPAQGVDVAIEKTVGIGQRMAQVMERLAQVVACLHLSRIRPEQVGKMLAGLWGVAMQQQISEHRMQARATERRHRSILVDEVELTEESYLQDRQRHGRLQFVAIQAVIVLRRYQKRPATTRWPNSWIERTE